MLFRIIGYTGTAGVLRLAVGLVSQKVIAVFLGASGLAILANLRSLIEVLGTFSSVGAQNGIISQTASSESKASVRALLNTTITLFLGASLLIGVLVFWQHEWLAFTLQIDLKYGALVQAVAFTIPFMGMMILLEAVLSGKKAFKYVSKVQLFTASVTAILMVILLFYYGLLGALIALLYRPIIGFVFYLYHYKKATLHVSFFAGFKFDLSRFKDLLPYIFMSLLAVGLVHIVEIYLRGLIASRIDLQSAGLWTAMNTISSNYFVFVSAVFSLYVLPRYSEKTSSFHLLQEVKSILKTLLPIVSVAMILVYLFRAPITTLLYSIDFTSITTLFKWQLTADWVRVIFLVFGYYLVAKKRLIDYIIVELFSFSTLIGLSLYWIDTFGIEGIVMANAVRYLGCLVLVVLLLRKKLVN